EPETGQPTGRIEDPADIGKIRRQCELRAYDQWQTGLTSLQVCPDDAGHRAFVGDRQGRVVELMRPLDQLLGVGGAAQEREVADAVKLGVGGGHWSWRRAGATGRQIRG